MVSASVTRNFKLLLGLVVVLFSLLVVEELVHRLLHVVCAVRNGRQMPPVFGDEEAILILTQVQDGRLRASRYLRRVRSYLADRLLLPGKDGVTYLPQLGSPFSYCVDVALNPLQVKSMALPAILRVPRKGSEGVCMRS